MTTTIILHEEGEGRRIAQILSTHGAAENLGSVLRILSELPISADIAALVVKAIVDSLGKGDPHSVDLLKRGVEHADLKTTRLWQDLRDLGLNL